MWPLELACYGLDPESCCAHEGQLLPLAAFGCIIGGLISGDISGGGLVDSVELEVDERRPPRGIASIGAGTPHCGTFAPSVNPPSCSCPLLPASTRLPSTPFTLRYVNHISPNHQHHLKLSFRPAAEDRARFTAHAIPSRSRRLLSIISSNLAQP